MSAINPAFFKIGGGLVAAGGATTIGIVYKGKFFEWINGNDDYVFIVSSSTADVTPTSSKKLYEDNTKQKNYKCKYDEHFYECDIIEEIKADSKKILKVDDLSKKNIDTNLEASKLKHTGTDKLHFLLKVKNDSKKAIVFDTAKSFEIVENDSTKESNKLFGKLTPVLGKQNGKAIGKFQFFLAQVKSFTNTAGDTFAITSSDSQKCYFDSNSESASKKACEIHKLSSTDTDSQKTKFEELTFDGKTPATKISSGNIKLQEYYIIKFTDTNKIEANEFNGKNLMFLNNEATGTSDPQKTINFQPINGIDLIEVGSESDKNHLIIF